jgi:hypothetical protein
MYTKKLEEEEEDRAGKFHIEKERKYIITT